MRKHILLQAAVAAQDELDASPRSVRRRRVRERAHFFGTSIQVLFHLEFSHNPRHSMDGLFTYILLILMVKYR